MTEAHAELEPSLGANPCSGWVITDLAVEANRGILWVALNHPEGTRLNIDLKNVNFRITYFNNSPYSVRYETLWDIDKNGYVFFMKRSKSDWLV